MKLTLPIRYKILFGFTIILLFSLATSLIGFRITEQLIQIQTEKLLSEKAHTSADQIQNFLSKIELDHLGIAHTYRQDTDPSSEKLKDVVLFTLRQNTFFEQISILSQTGRELLKADRFGIQESDTLYFEIPTDAFKKAIAGQTGLSKVYFSENDSLPHLDMFSPIISEKGAVLGVIKGQLRLDRMWDVIAQSNLGKEGFSYVVDEEGRLIAHPNQALVKKAPILNTRPIIAALLKSGKESTQTESLYANESGTNVIASGVKIPVLNWVVLSEQPVEEAFRELNFVRILVFVTLIGSLILLIVFSIILSENITRPIHILSLFAEGIKQGSFESSVNVKSGDEIEQLGQSLNVMNAQLKKYVHELSEKIEMLEAQKKNLDESKQRVLTQEQEVQRMNIELKHEKEVISAERNKLTVILSGIEDAVVAVDLNKRISSFNSAAEIITGYAAKEVLGKPIQEVLHFYENNEEIPVQIYAPFRNDTFEGVLFERKRITFKGKKDDILTINLITEKIAESISSNVGCILTIQDLSQEVALEKMKIDFVSMAAHELRTPLTIVRGYTQMLDEDKTTPLTKQQQEYVNRILISVRALSDLIDNLLNVSHIEQGKFKVNLFPIQMSTIIEEAVHSFQSYVHSKEQKLTAVVPHDLPIVMADKIRITQVLSNLVANAINYTQPKGEIIIQASLKHDENRTPQNYVQISVKDNGQGIPKDALAHLFTKFYRVSGILEQGSKGTGLGLFISKTIMGLHHGDIWAESELGKGSTFTFIIPVATEDEIKTSTPGQAAEQKHGIILNQNR